MADLNQEEPLPAEEPVVNEEAHVQLGQGGDRRRIALRNAQAQPLQFLRQPPLLRKESDIDLYLRRFLAYTDSIQAGEEDLVHLLINSMSDEILMSVERHLHNDITYDELAAILRRELGEGMENREEYKAKLRKAIRSKSESVRSFYIRIWQYARKSYEDQAVRNNALRDSFLCGIGDHQIAARLREQHLLDNEQILEQAVLLMNCKNASQTRLTQSSSVNSMTNELGTHDTGNTAVEAKLNCLIDLMTANAVAQQTDKSPTGQAQTQNTPTKDYAYDGPKTNIGLEPASTHWQSMPQQFNQYNDQQQIPLVSQNTQFMPNDDSAYQSQPTNWNSHNNSRPQQSTENFRCNNNYNNDYRYMNEGPRYRYPYQYQNNDRRQYNDEYQCNRDN